MSSINNVQMRNIDKSFYQNLILNDVSVDFYAGEVHALLGENGAGKTSLMNILTGVYAQDKGQVIINQKPAQFKSPGDALKAGIGMVHQRFSLIEKLSVYENLLLGHSKAPFFMNNKLFDKELAYYMDLFGFHFNPKQTVEDFPVGSRQKIEIIKMLLRDVSILILDEPTSVLTAQESDRLMQTLRKIAETGRTVVFISHKMNEVMQVADRISVLRKGQKVATLCRAEADLNQLALLMVGKQIKNIEYREKKIQNDVSLDLKGIQLNSHSKEGLKNINLCINKGEILGIAGVDGNGQRDLADVISGHKLPDSGSIHFKNIEITRLSIHQRIEKGFAYIPENRGEVATAGQSSIWENLSLKIFNRKAYKKMLCLNINKLKQHARTMIEKYEIANPGLQQPAIVLSGGNLQKLILAREIEMNGEVYIFIHPTRGLDIASTNFVRSKIQELSLNQKIVIVISGDLDELFELSDHIAVMYEGQIVDTLGRDRFDIQNIGLLMSGIKNGQEKTESKEKN